MPPKDAAEAAADIFAGIGQDFEKLIQRLNAENVRGREDLAENCAPRSTRPRRRTTKAGASWPRHCAARSHKRGRTPRATAMLP